LVDLQIRSKDPATRSLLHRIDADEKRFYDDEGLRIRTGREIKEVPREIQALAATVGGLNFLGEPNYRIVWGWARLTLIGGEWTDLDADGNYYQTVGQYRWEPKNMPFDRWHLERWFAPETFGSPEDWHDYTKEEVNGVSFASLGPYPSRGEYEACYCFENPDGSYQSLEPHVVETVIRALNYQLTIPAKERRAALDKREKLKKKADDDFAYALVDDCYPAFHGKPNVSVPGKEEPQ
jgi:hypothetical protein